MKIAVTGATGFIGRELVRKARRLGFHVYELNRSGTEGIRWSLGDELPEICGDADCIVHLACSTIASAARNSVAMDNDVNGTRILLNGARALRDAGHRIRFIFISSQSARENAANRYGRSKLAIESLLVQADEFVLRPGLVYGEGSASVAGMFERLATLPVIPSVHTAPSIQPVHVTELATAILDVARLEGAPGLLCVGQPMPLTFREAILATSRRLRRNFPIMVPVPMAVARTAARLADQLFETTLSERLEGLVSLRPMETSATLELLGLKLAPFDTPYRTNS